MKTTWRVLAVMAIAVTTLCGCRNSSGKEDKKTAFSLLPPSHGLYETDVPKIRFRNGVQKDPETLAKEKISEEWNRNLMLWDGSCCLEDYMERNDDVR